jgi:hypothetical protein
MCFAPGTAFAALALLLERGSEAVEARFPQVPVLREPLIELAERLGAERVEAPLPNRPSRDEAPFVEDAQMAGDPGLVDADLFDDIGDLPLAAPQRCDDKATRGIGQGQEDICMCHGVYVYTCIYASSRHRLRARGFRQDHPLCLAATALL